MYRSFFFLKQPKSQRRADRHCPCGGRLVRTLWNAPAGPECGGTSRGAFCEHTRHTQPRRHLAHGWFTSYYYSFGGRRVFKLRGQRGWLTLLKRRRRRPLRPGAGAGDAAKRYFTTTVTSLSSACFRLKSAAKGPSDLTRNRWPSLNAALRHQKELKNKIK